MLSHMPRAKGNAVDFETLVTDLNDLRAFTLVSDLLSITAAAKLMGESKATVSRRIARLENALGTSLIRRSTRAVETTDEGVAYRLRVGELLGMLGEANAAAVRGSRAPASGLLRVTVPPGLSNALAPVFAGFCAQYPQVVLTVHVASRIVDIEAEHFDAAVRGVAMQGGPSLPDSSLIALRIGDAPLERIVVAAPSYIAANPAPRRPQDLPRHRIIGMSDTGTTYAVTLLSRASAERIELNLPVSIGAANGEFIKELALSGAGVAIMPRLSVQKDLETRRLVHLLPNHVAPGLSLFLLHRGGRFVAPKVRAFVDYTRSALAEGFVESPGASC